MTFHPKTLILFVHGFLGSESSFVSFPLDLIQSIRTFGIPNLEARLFPFFATKGDPNKSINLLYNWLLLNATQPEYESVIIVCHSMGGLIAVEAFRKLQQFQNDKVKMDESKSFEIASANLNLEELNRKTQLKPPPDNPTSIQPAGTSIQPESEKVDEKKGWFGSWFSRAPETKEIQAVEDTLESIPVEKDQPVETFKMAPPAKPFVNVSAIICFDSPFNGLNPTVFTFAVGDQAADIISSYVPSRHSETVNTTIKYGNKLAKTAVVGSINAVASIPQATTTALKSVSSLPGTIYSSLPSASDALTATKSIPSTVYSSLPSASDALAATKSIPSALSTGASYALAAPSAVSSTISYYWPWGATNNADEPSMLIPGPENNELVQSVSEVTLNETTGALDLDKPEVDDEKGPELLPIPQDSDWSPWLSLGLTTAAVAGGAYYFSGSLLAIGTMTVVRRVALAYAVSHAEEARQRLQFLYPIWGESSKEAEARLLFLKEMNEKGSFLFKAYFIEFEDEESKEKRTFIRPVSEEYKDLFYPIGTDSTNEIAAHMNLFSRQDNPGHYWKMIHDTSQDIRSVIMKQRKK